MKPKAHTKTIYELQAEICGALANPVRLQILDLLAQGEMTSAQLLKELNIPKANLSQHISVLRDAGIIKSRRAGLFQVLSLALPKIKEACALVQVLLMERMEQEDRNNAEVRKALRVKG